MRLPAALLTLILASCAGYQLGGAKPEILREVRTIALPMFGNDTLHPRAETIATSAAADALVLDGTYRLATTDDADAILEGRIQDINYIQLRAERLDTLRPEELQNVVVIAWLLRDANNRERILASGSSFGTSRFFVDSNLQTSRNNALPDALESASESMISSLANGF